MLKNKRLYSYLLCILVTILSCKKSNKSEQEDKPTVSAPAPSSFEPQVAYAGANVTIRGSNFTGATKVTFEGKPALSFQVISDATISARVPAGSTGSIEVITPNGSGKIAGFTSKSQVYDPTLNYRVHLFYYTWYGDLETDKSWIHWTQAGAVPPNDLASNFYPTLGSYSSKNDAVIAQHMAWIKEAKVGVIAITWWGKNSREDQLVSKVMDAADQYGIKVAFHLEPYGGSTAVSTVNDINYINDKYGNHPAFYRSEKFNYQPVYYIFNSLRIADWSALSSVNKSNIIFTQTTDQSKAQHFAGFYTYSAPNKADVVDLWKAMSNYSKNNGKIWCPSIGPGYVDTRIGGSLETLRENGAMYEKNWEWAIASDPEWISITSFNEWHEGSQIEPTSYAPPARSSHNYYTYQGTYGLTNVASEKAYITKTAEWVSKWK